MSAAEQLSKSPARIPFDTKQLDRLMDDAGIDVLLATSKHSVQYLLGGHRSFFFESMDAVGLNRYLPILVYPKGAPDKAAYFGHRSEGFQVANEPLWVGQVQTTFSGSVDTMSKAIDYICKAGLKTARIGAELPFLPLDVARMLQDAFPSGRIVEGLLVLERLRARKRPDELEKLRIASNRVIESMQAVISGHKPGATKRELADALRREETNRGLIFDYCLITAGTSLNRAPSEQKWQDGEILSLDSGGNYHGYIGDLCRMAIFGEPDSELIDLLAEIESIQRAAFSAVKPGAIGGDIFVAAEKLLGKSKFHNNIEFVAHGMGLVAHEAPRLTSTGPVPYPADDAARPLETGMIVSIETTLKHPSRGFIKLEDTVAVTDKGFEIFGEGARGWNRGGQPAAR